MKMRSGALLSTLIRSALLILGLGTVGSPLAQAFPSFIGYGYKSCTACHYNPMGGGPLTDYGRALGATTISGRPFFAPKASDDELGEMSGFLGKTTLPDWFRPAGFFRELLVDSDLQNKPTTRWVTMQAEGSLTVPLMDQRLIFSGTLGYIPSQDPNASTLISREHYVGYRVTKTFGIYAGFMDPAFGIHAPDHRAYFRAMTLLDQADQVHGVLLRFASEKFEAGVHGFLGNLFQDANLRQTGVTAMAEYEAIPDTRLGLSALASGGTFRSHQIGALHARIGIPEGHSILAEAGVQRFGFSTGQQLSQFLWIQSSIRLFRGMSFMTTVESYVADLNNPGLRLWRVGPSLDYFPFQRLEFRLDFLGTESIGDPLSNPDVYTLLLQGHVWL